MSMRRIQESSSASSATQTGQTSIETRPAPRATARTHAERTTAERTRQQALTAATSADKAAALTHKAPANRGAVDLYAWQNKDPQQDGVEGTRTDRAYAELGVRTGVKPVIVAVIDSGVDIDHEDLQGRLWSNAGEIPGNGIDDDHNGYPDDVHGWNFLGTRGADGRPVNIDRVPLVITRELGRLEQLAASRDLTPTERQQLDDVRAAVERRRSGLVNAMTSYSSLREQVLATMRAVDEGKADASQRAVSREALEAALARYDAELAELAGQLGSYVNPGFDPRAKILGDDPFDFGDRFYGNSDVEGPDAMHGTHVAGIIAAVRGNGLGIDGIANDVRIMAIRAVPDGDEYDKDVANAVRYAVDNGADIINMSFGKPYSPGKDAVDAAFRYAAKKGVLVVHAAGNDHSDNDRAPNYPARYTGMARHRPLPNWIEVGASSAQGGQALPAQFSNYGAKTVDLFAPGVQIPSTIPQQNGYAELSGTSMAAPTVTGVAALILSQFPALRGAELRSLLLESARRRPDLMVRKPTGRPQDAELVPFGSLSITGAIVDAYEALQLAQVRYGAGKEQASV